MAALENVLAGKLQLKFSLKVLHLLDFPPWAAEWRLGGAVQQALTKVATLRRKRTAVGNPSVKNRRFLPAPFTQGSLGAVQRFDTREPFGRCRASAWDEGGRIATAISWPRNDMGMFGPMWASAPTMGVVGRRMAARRGCAAGPYESNDAAAKTHCGRQSLSPKSKI